MVIRYLLLIISAIFLIVSWFSNVLDRILTSTQHGVISLILLCIVYLAWRKKLN